MGRARKSGSSRRCVVMRTLRRALDHALPQARDGVRLVERDADLVIVAPDRMAGAHEMVAVDVKRELRRQSNRICDVDARAARREISHRAVDDTAVVKRQPSALEYAVPGVRTPLDTVFAHGRHSQLLQVFQPSLSRADCGLINFDCSDAGYRFILH
jgi:hypothetical protein